MRFYRVFSVHNEGLSSVGLNPFHYSQPRSGYKNHTRSLIHDFMRSVLRMIFLTSVFIRATSCTLRGDSTSVRDWRFRATSCTLRGAWFHIVACILMHEWFSSRAFYSCNELHATVPSECDFELNVACILMHDRITHDTLFISCNELHATARMISHRALFYVVWHQT